MELRDPNHDRGSSSIAVRGQGNTQRRTFTVLCFKLCLTIIVHNYSASSNGDVHSVTIKNITFNQIVVAC